MAYEQDFLVLGSGIAGLSFALRAAQHGQVSLVTKKASTESATNYAQGGIAAVVASDDSFEAHVQDTLSAGQGLCDEETVRFAVERGPAAVRRLVNLGVRFDPANSGPGYDLGREGGHSRRRVLHASDFTGREIERALVEAVRAHPRIEVFPHRLAVDLVTSRKLGEAGPPWIRGAYVLDSASGSVEAFRAPIVFLGTGGCGKVYLYTTNPEIASGDGIAMAYRAGSTIANMEFIQFHPTCLYHPDARSFLISEAIRGEGGILRTRSGQAFMAHYHEQADLAPRDVIARAIDAELKQSGDDCVFLDCTAMDPSFVERRFPNISRRLLDYGIDLCKEPVPVVPAAHYCCGGVRTDLRGETEIGSLFAAGETASTGLHGANRLASNSLLEGIVFAEAAAERAIERLEELRKAPRAEPSIAEWDTGDAVDPAEAILVNAHWDEIRRFMWNYVGIVRSDKRLQRARRRVELLRTEVRQYYWTYRLTPDLVELRNLADVAWLIVHSALARKESRGLHFTLDHPRPDPGAPRDTQLRRGDA
ncbi:MAG: L-aspartate oxidase [Myxococcales bacterium]|nr:L-aspartate oxidase [Myxococcales bacterium]